ncbi:MAG: hypothetical protein WC881_09580, partial [Elusimicrobiota bacterium]
MLLLRGRKTLVALLVVALLVSFVFTAPSRFPGVADMLGLGASGGRITFSSLRAAFKTAKDNRDLSWAALFSRSSGVPGPSSVGLVRGSAAEMGLAGVGRAGGAGADGLGRNGRGGADAYGRRIGSSINGIMNPEDAALGGEGVAVDDTGLGRGGRTGLYGATGPGAGLGADPGLNGYSNTSAGTRLGDG